MVLLPDELDIIVDGLLADVRKVRIMFPQVVANAAAGNGGMRRPARRHGVCNAVLCVGGLPPSLGIEDVVPYYGTHQDDGLSAQC